MYRCEDGIPKIAHDHNADEVNLAHKARHGWNVGLTCLSLSEI